MRIDVAVVVAVVGALVAPVACVDLAPETPGAFYTPPDPLPDAPPGTLLRSEPMPDDLPEGAEAWRILYLSTDHAGRSLAVSGFVVAPAEEAGAPRPVLAWAHGTTGIRPACGVSHTSDPYQQTPAVEAMLEDGYVVVATDYPGLGTPGVHPYLVGPTAAHAVLDAVRAARSLDAGAGSRFAVWGASQGGHAALWTAQLAPAYAPELDLVAGAASAPATDLAGILGARYDEKAGGVFLAELLTAWAATYPDADLDRIVADEHRSRFDRMAATCVTTPAAFLLVGGILTPRAYLREDVREVEPWRRLLAENTPRGAIDVPILLTQGTDDDVVPPGMTLREAFRRCAAGERVTVLQLPGIGHDARDESAEPTLAWLRDRFAGRRAAEACGGASPTAR